MRGIKEKQLREENEERLIEQGVRRSERIKEKKQQMHQANQACEITIPKNYEEALNSEYKDQWTQAMEEEMQRMKKLEVWELVERKTNMRPVKSKWVFSVKKHNDGTIKKFKSRLVATGYDQILGEDYNETYSPTIRPETIRLLLKIAAVKNVKPKQKDVQTAFLHGELEEDIYMYQAPGFATKNDKMCHLKKGIYGQKQSQKELKNLCGLKT